MNRFFTTLALSALAFRAAHAAPSFAPIGPANFNLTAYVQAQELLQIAGKTNETHNSTNTITTYSSSIGARNFTSSDMLALITNSFNTNFPAGSQVGIMEFGAVVVVDSTGTNVIFDPGAVVYFEEDEPIFSTTETVVFSQNPEGFSESGNDNISYVISGTLTYNDTFLTTADSTHTQFHFAGLFLAKETDNLKTRVKRIRSVFQGTASGPVRGLQTILSGSISANTIGRVLNP